MLTDNHIIDGKKIDSTVARLEMKDYKIKWVPILDTNFILPETINEMISYADGISTLHNTLREGVVIRDADNTVSFKCISNEFLIKHSL